MAVRLERVFLMNVALFFRDIATCLAFVQISTRCQTALSLLKVNPMVFRPKFAHHAAFAALFPSLETLAVDDESVDAPALSPLLDQVAAVRFTFNSLITPIAKDIAPIVTELRLKYCNRDLFRQRLPNLRRIFFACDITSTSFRQLATSFPALERVVCTSITPATDVNAFSPPPFHVLVRDQKRITAITTPVENITLFSSWLVRGTNPTLVGGRDLVLRLPKGFSFDINPVLKASLPVTLDIDAAQTSITAPIAVENLQALSELQLAIGPKPFPSFRPKQGVPPLRLFAPNNTLTATALTSLTLKNVSGVVFPSSFPLLVFLCLSECTSCNMSNTSLPRITTITITSSKAVSFALSSPNCSVSVSESDCVVSGLHHIIPSFSSTDACKLERLVFEPRMRLEITGLTAPHILITGELRRPFLTNCSFETLTVDSEFLFGVAIDHVTTHSASFNCPLCTRVSMANSSPGNVAVLHDNASLTLENCDGVGVEGNAFGTLKLANCTNITAIKTNLIEKLVCDDPAIPGVHNLHPIEVDCPPPA